MQQFIMDGYSKSRIERTKRSVRQVSEQWTPPARGPALVERVGMVLVTAGASLVRDRSVLERLIEDPTAEAA